MCRGSRKNPKIDCKAIFHSAKSENNPDNRDFYDFLQRKSHKNLQA
jgi:hypothetical protein